MCTNAYMSLSGGLAIKFLVLLGFSPRGDRGGRGGWGGGGRGGFGDRGRGGFRGGRGEAANT